MRNKKKGNPNQKGKTNTHFKETEDFKEKVDEWCEFGENESAVDQKSQILKQYDYARNGARENTGQKVEQKISKLGTEKCRIYFQDEANEEDSEEPLNKTMTKARNWTETIIVALLCSMVLYTIHSLTGMAPEIMCYLIVGIKITMDVKEQRKREMLLMEEQKDTTKIIKKRKNRSID